MTIQSIRTADIVALTGLVLTAGVLGLVWPQAHWTSIWMDREFTGWVAPISNRLHEGIQLYADGGHSPIPPLSFLLIEALTRGKALWIDESIANYTAQWVTLLFSFLAARVILPLRYTLPATIFGGALFLSLPKTIFYDSLVQAEIAVSAFFLAMMVAWATTAAARYGFYCAALLFAGLAILTKQSSGILYTVGLLAVTGPFWISYSGWRRGSGVIIGSALFLIAGTSIAVALLSPWVSPSGFVFDVLLTGAEPKGGVIQIIRNLKSYLFQILYWLVEAIGITGVCLGVSHSLIVLAARIPSIHASLQNYREMQYRRTLFLVFIPLLLLVLLRLTLVLDFMFSIVIAFLWVRARLLVDGLVSSEDDARADKLAMLLIALLFAAVGHTLSVSYFRVFYDNNPLIIFIFATVFWLFDRNIVCLYRSRATQLALIAGLAIACTLEASQHLRPQIDAIRRATARWPEIRFLNGAFLNPSAAGVRRLVEVVRKHATESDTVLLLPNDPNVQAWFDRPLPNLSSLIIFVDQYRDRYVEADYRALKDSPPKIIVLGPIAYWRAFFHKWQSHQGAERLIDLVKGGLLSQKYSLIDRISIRYGGNDDIMEVYLRNPD